MRIYKINIEHKKWGANWDSRKIAAKSLVAAIRKVKLKYNESITDAVLLASTD